MKTTQEIREKAAKLLEEHGWCQGAFREFDDLARPTGRCCMMGAVRVVMGAYDDPGSLDFVGYDLVQRELASELKQHPYDFNDAEGRTAQDVIAALRGAA